MVTVSGNPNPTYPTNPTNPTNPTTKYRCEFVNVNCKITTFSYCYDILSSQSSSPLILR